jgi:tRNA1(Val) A37 N6-methylase TrmN6
MSLTPELIREDECIDDLQCGGLMLLQKKNGFKFGIDAVLLADFAKHTASKRTLDLCTGTGIVAVLLSAKTRTPVIDALEIQHEICDMAKRSVRINDIEDRVHITEGDLKKAAEIYGKAVFDKITVNPPYMKAGTGIFNNENPSKTISRHEVSCTLEDVIKSASELLCPKGRFYMVHRPSRLADILCLMRQYRIEPKCLRMVHPSPYKPANLLLVEGVKNGGSELKLTEPLYVYDENGNYTKEIDLIYGRT